MCGVRRAACGQSCQKMSFARRMWPMFIDFYAIFQLALRSPPVVNTLASALEPKAMIALNGASNAHIVDPYR